MVGQDRRESALYACEKHIEEFDYLILIRDLFVTAEIHLLRVECHIPRDHPRQGLPRSPLALPSIIPSFGFSQAHSSRCRVFQLQESFVQPEHECG
jgi:hypothetical protein